MTPEVHGAGVRALLHHQARRPGHRSGPLHGLRLRQAVGRPRQDLQRAGPGHDGRIYLPRARQAEDVAPPTSTPARSAAAPRRCWWSRTTRACARPWSSCWPTGLPVLKAKDAQSALAIVESGVADRPAVHRRGHAGAASQPASWRGRPGSGCPASPSCSRRATPRTPSSTAGGWTRHELLSKPYSREALARKIRHVLRNQEQRR